MMPDKEHKMTFDELKAKFESEETQAIFRKLEEALAHLGLDEELEALNLSLPDIDLS